MTIRSTTHFSARKRLIAAAISACFSSAPVWGNPTAPQVVSGSASFSQAGKLLTVANSPGAIINWNTFSIGVGETTRFNQASAASSVLNRVLANDPSVLLGTLSSNGRVWLVNPAGIMVGQGARIDVAGFVASTLNVRNEDFLANRLNFQATPNAGKVQNYGQIGTPSGGSVYLVAPAVENLGIINAPNGEVILAAGQTVQLVDTGTPGVKVDIKGTEGSATNLGEIVAEAGRIGMAGVLVKNGGTLNASSVVNEGGRIFLRASQDATAGGSISANSQTGAGGRIEVAGAAVSVPGGTVLDASGETKGGAIVVGGGYQGKDAAIANATTTTIEDSATLKADATGSGDGGLIVAWSDGATRAHASFSARGGNSGGAGGLIETSGKQSLDVAGARVDTRAADGSAGNWLLDPADITIVNATATGSPNYAPSGVSSSIADADIITSLQTTNVTITTSSGSGGNITMNGGADSAAGGAVYISTSGSAARTLTLDADGNIDIHGGAQISANTGAPLTLNFYARGGNIRHAGTSYNYGSSTFLSKGDIKFGDGSYNGSVYSYGSPISLLANWDGASTSTPLIAASGQCASVFCGIGGSGNIDSYAYSNTTVTPGAVTLKAPGDINLSGISIYARGGNGYNTGNSGGDGAVVNIASTLGNLTTGSIDARGGDGSTGVTGISSAVNGGMGGAGVAGGAVSLSAAGTLTLGGTISVAGGSGGQGGSSYYSAATYSGTGGNGGPGGNAGTISVNGASLVLSGVTLKAIGGPGGTGSIYGTANGSAGAGGTSSPITLATAGDIAVTGYNYVDASQMNLLAGSNIHFGTTGPSPTSGNLYSNYYSNQSSPIALVANWNGLTTSPDVAASGQCADSSFCGIGGTGVIDSNYYNYGGSQPNAGSVTLKAPGNIDLTSLALYARGNSGYNYGDAGGAGGTINITSTKGNLTTGYIEASGGGGSSGISGSSGVANGGAGGAGGTGGTINLSAAGTLTIGGSTYVNAGYGGSGGSGYYTYDSGSSSYIYSGTGGNGGAGGNAGTISASSALLVQSGSTLNANGGSGGSGAAGNALGLAGDGGAGGNVVLTATTGNLATGNINAVGGSGGSGPSGVNNTANGGAGGVGGAGGTINLSTPGVLTLSGTASVAGGQGGYGGSGYSAWDSGSSSYIYSGTGGTGGAGGNAGAISESGTSLALSGATLNAAGGAGGAGGYYGTSSGSAGTGGSASPITLSTAGDIIVTGYNAVDASQLNLLSGKSISFGITGTSPTSGYLNANGSFVTLVANWDGVSTAVPAIAASGQCTDGSFCGISGSGAIDSNYYYYGSHPNAGSVTLKAPGDIDLSSIAIYARGNSGYNYGDAGGVGGAVSIASTKSNLTTGYIDASGGSGDSGSYGTSSNVNGGTGGVGGAGGSINLSAVGTLTLGGSTFVRGGSGGYGGSGYDTWDSGTSTYVYSGSGGNGGAGGSAGTITASGATLVVSEATLNAYGGSSGSGGHGTTAGLAGGGGIGGTVTLTATTGDIATGYIDASGGEGGSGTYGISGVLNGGTGGVGGAGGMVNLSAPGTLTLSGTTRVEGGDGGYGGSGYYDYGISAYTGTGANGGAGGNAGNLSVSAASLVLSGATLNVNGGSGGSGGSGSAAGSVGGRGSGSAITLATAGDIDVTGYDYVNASQLSLLAGKSIRFGTTGTNPASGNLYSYGTPVTLLANWNGSTAAPEIAATGQCAGSSFCGIGGSGSIDNYYYYSSLLNAGAMTLQAPGDIDLSDISIYARGNSGSGYGSNGGAGGAVSITSTKGNLTTSHIDASGGSGSSGAYGNSTVVNGGMGGAGGSGGTVILSAAGTLTLGGTTSVAGGYGGYGGSGYYTWDSSSSSSVYSGTGANGGAGGNAGTISVNGASLLLTSATLNANGGAGGTGGDGTSAGSAGARGAAGPVMLSTSGDITVTGSNYVDASQMNLLAGKSIGLGTGGDSPANGYLYSSHGSPITLVANWNGSTTAPDVAATAQCGTLFCGIGGSGSINTNYYDYYYEQLQSGDGGAITLKAAGPIDLRSIDVISNGASGYYYGVTQEASRGGTITISSTQSDVTLGTVSAIGGYGRDGTGGSVSDPNGGAGGTGGAGGSITASAAGSLLLLGEIDASGGGGGTGGDGHYDSSLAIPVYTGGGGAGGAGGNSGSITLGGGSITLDNANLRVLGGYPGSGSTYGTSTGAQGAFGVANTLQLGTTGDITVLGNNNLAANRIALLAGKTITLGSSASGSSGEINSTGSDTLLVANWNGSTDTPGIAGAAQCATLFCGISGTGSITNGYDYYQGYYYTGGLQNQNGGAITLKAAGPIDLSAISVNSIGGDGGSYAYSGIQDAGTGGVVTVSSTQGDVTLGNVSVVGGYGRYGTAGTAIGPDGATGGAGGAGGSVSASATGALMLNGHINAAGGSGGDGGYAYYDYSLATPAYAGTGGAGGAGGNAGTMSLSGASLLVSGTTLNAEAGSGGFGGAGTTAGLAGAVGTGGNIILSATVGNLTLDSGAALSASAAGDALVLAAAGNFTNNADASALSAPNGRWLVYSTNPAADVRGGLDYAFKHYGLGFDGSAYTGPGVGKGFIYSVVPSLDTALTGTASKTYDGTTTGSLLLSNFSGIIDGDTVLLGGLSSGVFADKNVGSGKGFTATVALAGATNATTSVYGSAIASGNIGQIMPAPLTVSAPTVTKTYDGTTNVPSGFAASVGALAGAAGGGDTVATAASLAYADKHAGTGNRTVNASGLAIKDSLGADMSGNYAITYAPDVASTITQKAVTLTAPAVTKTYDGTTTYTSQTADLTALSASLVGGDTVSAATIAYTNKNAGTGTKAVTLDAATISDGNNGANYSVMLAGNSASTINPAALSITATGVGKVYDGLTSASVTYADNRVAGDVLTAGGSASYVDKNVGVGKAVNVNGITLTGADAGNYTLSGSTATTSADITVRPLATWIGGTSGNWSVAANWDALPDLSNVTEVSVPAGTIVTYDAAAGSTNLASLTAAGLSIAGGSLNVANSLTVSSSFSHSGGTLGLGSNADANIIQATGDLIIRNLTAQKVALTAQSGGVSQAGPIVASVLVTKSVSGTNLSDAGNKVNSFTATNNGSGNVSLVNTGALSIESISNSNGSITIDNTGAVTTAGAVSALAGAVSILAHSPLSIGAGGVSASGDITLTAGETAAATDHLTLGGAVQTTGSAGAITLAAGDSIAQNANVASSGGAVNATAQAGSISMAPGAKTTSGGGSISYKATAGDVTLASLDAGSGAIDLSAGGNINSAAGSSGANLIGDKAVIAARGNANLSTQVKQLDVTVAGKFSIADLLTGSVLTDVPEAEPLPATVVPVLDQVLSTVTATTTQTTTQAAEQTAAPTAPPPVLASAPAGSGPLLLSNTTQTIGGTTDTFGGSSAAPSVPAAAATAPVSSGTATTSGTTSGGTASGGQSDKPVADKPATDKPAGAKPEDDKSASAKKDEGKAEEKKEDKKDDKKKDEDAGPKKASDKPAPKKLATCS